MNKNDLLTRLKNENVPESCYSLDGGLPNDRFVLNENDEIWEVYYTERGNVYEKKKFSNEDLACDYLYERIKKMLKVY